MVVQDITVWKRLARAKSGFVQATTVEVFSVPSPIQPCRARSTMAIEIIFFIVPFLNFFSAH